MLADPVLHCLLSLEAQSKVLAKNSMVTHLFSTMHLEVYPLQHQVQALPVPH